MTKAVLIGIFSLLMLAPFRCALAQDQIANSSAGSRQQDGLTGQVRRVRVETVNLLVKEGKTVEAPRVLREITTYDQKGQKIDSVAYPAENSAPAGNKQQYLYDAKGNIIEMVSRGDDGSVLSKEKYDYQFDEFGNWIKMTASYAVYENGTLSSEPFEITYRTITYYFGQPAPKVTTAAATARGTSNTKTNATASGAAEITKPTSDNKPKSDAPASVAATGVAATGVATSDVKKSSDAGEGITKPRTDAPANVVATGVAATGIATSDVKRSSDAGEGPVKPEKSEPAIATPVAATRKDDSPVSVAATGTSDVKKPSDVVEAIVKPEKSEPSITTPAAATPTDNAPKMPVIRMSEDALRKAAIELPQPQYPEAALLTRAEGNVEVQILLDENGEVISASALSGNPVFTEVAAAAARKAKFSRAKLSPDPARIYGVINYTFTLPREQSAAPANANGASSELKAGQSNQGVSDLKILEPGASLEAEAKPATNLVEPAVSFYAKGSAFLASGRNSEAADAFRRATEHDPNDAAAYAKLGIAYVALKQYQEAVVVLKMAIRIKPEIVDAEAYYKLSNAYTALEKFPQALEAIKQATYIKRAEQANPEVANTAQSPSSEDLHYATGLAYYNLRRYSGAIEELKQVIALNPKMARAYFGLALSYIAIGDRKSAEKQQPTLKSLNPDFAAKIAQLLSSRSSNDQQGFGFVFKTNP